MQNIQNIQNISDNTLFDVISNGHDIEWNFFALKVMIMRLRLKLSMSGNKEEVVNQCYADLRDLFRKSSGIPSAKKDFQIIVERFCMNE